MQITVQDNTSIIVFLPVEYGLKTFNIYVMKTVVVKPIKFKDGTEWPAGTPVHVQAMRERPSMSIIKKTVVNDPAVDVRRVHSVNLYLWFAEFPMFTPEDVDAAMMADICPSLTGESVEPDGWDSNGFPSLLLAVGC